MQTFHEIAKGINGKNAALEAQAPDFLADFMRRERVAERVKAAKAMIETFPKWYAKEIQSAVDAVSKIRFANGVPQAVQSLVDELSRPVCGDGVGGVAAPPLVDQLRDGIRYVE